MVKVTVPMTLASVRSVVQPKTVMERPVPDRLPNAAGSAEQSLWVQEAVITESAITPSLKLSTTVVVSGLGRTMPLLGTKPQ